MKKISVLAGAVLFIASVIATSSPTQAGYTPTHQPVNETIIVGDSISSPTYGGYNSITPWFKIFQKSTGTYSRTYSLGGSGFGKPGAGCRGTTIGQRINHPVVRDRMEHSRWVIVAAGINDYRECYRNVNGDWAVRPISDEKLDAAVAQAMADVARNVKGANGKVYVAVPYGDRAALKPYMARIVSSVKTHAASQGFHFVGMGNALNGYKSSDGIHPSQAGSYEISKRFLTAVRAS